MDLTGRATLSAAPERVFDVVADLATYPRWLGIVRSAAPDGDAAWLVDIGAKLGPLWRTKRIRMVRTEHDPPTRVRFEREERDGREHSAWDLGADVAPATELTMQLHYGGTAWIPFLDRILQDEIRRAGGRLERLLA